MCVELPRANRLELTFHTAELREICEKRTVAATELGYSAARELAERLADIEAAETVTELCELLGAAIWDKNPTEKAFRLGSTFEVTLVSGPFVAICTETAGDGLEKHYQSENHSD